MLQKGFGLGIILGFKTHLAFPDHGDESWIGPSKQRSAPPAASAVLQE